MIVEASLPPLGLADKAAGVIAGQLRPCIKSIARATEFSRASPSGNVTSSVAAHVLRIKRAIPL